MIKMSNEKVNLSNISNRIVTRGNGTKRKKTKSLYDTPLENRTYWGNDDGSKLVVSLGRNAIRKDMKFGILFDVDYDDLTRVLNKEYKQELIQFQLELMKELVMDREIMIIETNDHKWQIQWLI
jgi:CBS-domain-containing membrane protein